MLIVHPSSTCDVCLEPFAWQNPGLTPHAIPCGHVFCLQCLQSTHPSNCPLCRKAYIPERVKKLHVDPCTAEIEDDNPILQVNRHLRRLALVSGDHIPEQHAVDAISEVNAWLATHGPSEAVYRPLRNAVAALHRSIALHREATVTHEEMEQQGEELWKQIRLRDLDLQTARTVEDNLLDRLQRTEEECEEKLTRAERSRAEMEVEFMRMRAEHSQFREELAKYRTNPQVYPVQQPSRERPDRSVTSMSRRTSLSHSAHSVHSPSTRTDAAYLHSETERSIDTSPSISTVLDEARPRRTTRPSVVIPGAPEYKKIIPPLPAPFTFREFNPTSASINSRPPMPPPVSSRSSARVVEPDLAMRPDVRQTSQRSAIEAQTSSYDQVTPRAPTIPHHNRSPQYGYIPGVGYVPRSPPGERSLVSEQDNTQTPAAAGLMLYSQGSQQVDVTNTRTVEGAARAMAIQSGEIETHESTWGHVYHALVSRSNPSSSSLRTAHADSSLQPNASTPTSATSNLNGLGISSPPGRTSGSPAPVIQRRSDASPEPSAASSWGTVSSARSSRASLLEELMSLPGAIANLDVVARPSASRHSSISDLRLAGLPDPTFGDAVDNDGSGRDTPRLHSDRPIRPWPGSDPSLPPQGPSQSSDNTYALASRVSLAHDSGDISRALEPASASAGIGLMLASSASTHQQVSDQDDLQHVNRSLMQLVAEARNSRRRSRPMSLASADDRAEFHSESWEIRAQNVGAALGPDNGSVAQRSAGSLNPAPSSGARDGRDPRSALRQNTVSSTSQATDSARRRRHSNVTFASPPPLTSSVSFHSERQVLSPAIDDRVPSRPQNLGSFTQSSSSMLLDGSSLLLSMPPPGPSTSTATTSTGEPSSIRAPRPVSGLATNIFALWGSRNTR